MKIFCNIEGLHTRHFLLREFWMTCTSTEIFKDIYTACIRMQWRPCTYQLCLKDCDCEIFEKSRSKRRPSLNEELLKEIIELDPRIKQQTIGAVSCPTAPEDLQQNGETSEEWMWVIHKLFFENQTASPTLCSSNLLTVNANPSFLHQNCYRW